MLVYVWELRTLDAGQVWLGGDQALLLRGAEQILAGKLALVGTYSRDGTTHPGPMYLYLLAAMLALTGRHLVAVQAVHSIVQASTYFVLSLITYRVAGDRLVALAAPLLVVINYPFLIYLRIIWDPAIVVPLLASTIWLTLETIWGRPALFPAVAALASLTAQAHTSQPPLALALFALSAYGAWRHRDASSWRTMLWTALVLLVVWSPVVADAVTNRGGNLARLAALIGHPGDHPSSRDALDSLFLVVSNAIPGTYALSGWTCVQVSAVLCLLGALQSYRRTRVLLDVLLLVSVVWVVHFLTLLAVPGGVEPYYMTYTLVLVGLTVAGGCGAILWVARPMPARALVAVALMAYVATSQWRPAVATWRAFEARSWNQYPLDEMLSVTRAVSAGLTAPLPGEPTRRGTAGAGQLRAVAVRFAGGLKDEKASFLYLFERGGIVTTAPRGAPAYVIWSRRAYDASADREQHDGVQILVTPHYALQYLPSARSSQ